MKRGGQERNKNATKKYPEEKKPGNTHTKHDVPNPPPHRSPCSSPKKNQIHQKSKRQQKTETKSQNPSTKRIEVQRNHQTP